MGGIQEQPNEEEWVTIEEYISGEFKRHVNNSGIPCGLGSDLQKSG